MCQLSFSSEISHHSVVYVCSFHSQKKFIQSHERGTLLICWLIVIFIIKTRNETESKKQTNGIYHAMQWQKIRQRWMTYLQKKKNDDKPSTPFCRMRFWTETITINVTGNVFQRYDCTQIVALSITQK